MKTGQLIWSGIKSLTLTPEEKHWIEEEEISCIILFKRNISSLEQLYELCHSIHQLKNKPLIAMDREGGPVDRLKHLPECCQWPAPEQLAKVCSLDEIKKTAFHTGREMQAVGIAINFAPCWDLPVVPSTLFKGRLWASSANVKQINKNALAFLQGLEEAGLAKTAKHFPGHGGVAEDSHKTLPTDKRSWEEIEQKDLTVFQQAIQQNLDLIMTAHVLYPVRDSQYPASLSKIFLQKILREQLQFKGLIVPDDLDMKALSGPLKNTCINILKAGGDILLKCKMDSNNLCISQWIDKALQQKVLSATRLQEKIQRLTQFKQKFSNITPLSFSEWKNIITDPTSHQWCQELQNRIPSV